MIEVKEVEYDGEIVIDVGGRIYSREANPVGARKKWWGKMPPGNSVYFVPPKIASILFKFNRNAISNEDYGEVIASKFYRFAGVKSVEYFTCKYTDINEVAHYGVMCGSFKKNEDEIEMSGYSLQTVNTEFDFDRKTGKPNKSINTVDSFIRDLNIVLHDVENKDEILHQIRNELVMQAMLDFLLGQTDRHWLNTAFLMYHKNNEFSFRKSHIYDSGCIAYLKKKREAIKTYVSMMKGDYLNSDIMHTIMEKYCPMFGIKTCLVNVNVKKAEKYAECEQINVNPTKANKEAFLKELSQEILHNADIAYFYIKLKEMLNYNPDTEQINIDMLFEVLKRNGEEIPDEIREMVTAVVTYQLNEIEKARIKEADVYKGRDSYDESVNMEA